LDNVLNRELQFRVSSPFKDNITGRLAAIAPHNYLVYNTSQCKLPPSPTQKLAVFASQHCIIKIAKTCKYLVLSQGLFNDSGQAGWDAYRDPAHNTNSKERLYDPATYPT
jgi:hypothetical protein